MQKERGVNCEPEGTGQMGRTIERASEGKIVEEIKRVE